MWLRNSGESANAAFFGITDAVSCSTHGNLLARFKVDIQKGGFIHLACRKSKILQRAFCLGHRIVGIVGRAGQRNKNERVPTHDHDQQQHGGMASCHDTRWSSAMCAHGVVPLHHLMRDTVTLEMSGNRSIQTDSLRAILREDCPETLHRGLVVRIQQREDSVNVSVTEIPIVQELPGMGGLR